MELYIEKLNDIFEKENICSSHGIDHAVNVLKNINNMLDCSKLEMTEDQKFSTRLAGLLHDADDRKFFKNNKNYENAREIMKDLPENIINMAIRMIDLTSASKNKDSTPDDVIKFPWLLYPRHADRLEAIGKIGILRSWQYTRGIKMIYYNDKTARCKNIDEIKKVASLERYNNYKGISYSMIDHYYDKLFMIGSFKTENEYAENLRIQRMKPIINILIEFGKKGIINDDMIMNFLEKTEDENIK